VHGLEKKVTMPKVSIVLPVYNGEQYLAESIDSILAQTFKDFELVIIDDCSVDKTPSIAKTYLSKDPRISYIRNENNLKLPGALNRGFSLASGEYWTWTSCDNAYLPVALDEMVKTLDANNSIALTYASMELINDLGHRTGEIIAGPADDLIIRNVVGACFLYRASIAKSVGTYLKDAFLCEDFEYWLRIASSAQILPIQKILYRYRFHSDSLSSKNEEEIIAKGIAIQKKYYSHFVKTRRKAAQFYAYLRARDIYNPFRFFYFLLVIFYSPTFFIKEIYHLVKVRFKNFKNSLPS
jgi:glycosyltransferase involved in cell wall biosynthesis